MIVRDDRDTRYINFICQTDNTKRDKTIGCIICYICTHTDTHMRKGENNDF